MRERESTSADHGRSPPHDPPDAGGRVLHFERARQDAFSDRSRVRACILASAAIVAASSAPGVLSSGGLGPALLWGGGLFVPVLLFFATILTMRRRPQARRRGLRLLDPIEPERGAPPPATEG